MPNEQIRFTTRVLGPAAAYRLENRQVTQTLRSESDSIANAFLLGRVSPGDRLEIVLDNRLVGHVELVSMDVVTWEALDVGDARRGGFANRFQLAYALQRAGFRFMPLAKYEFYRIQFSWPEGNCYFCGREVTNEDYCYGCGHYVCEECEDYDAVDRPSGTHKVEDHKKHR